jgi:prophage regulatory protein
MTNTSTTPTPSLLRAQAVMALTGLNSKSSLYAAIAKGTFPKPIKLGVRSVAWPSDVVENWIAGRIAATKEG